MEIDLTPSGTTDGLETETPATQPGAGFPIEIVTRGTGAEHARRRLELALRRVAARSPRRPLLVRASLTFEPHHSLDARAEVKAAFEVGRHVIRAHAAAPTFAEAIDQLVDRLRHSLHELAERNGAARRGHLVEEPRRGQAAS